MFDHPLWRQKPVATAYRLLTCLVRQRVGGLNHAVVAYDGGRSKIEVDVRTPFGYSIYRYGLEDSDIAFVKSRLEPGALFVDGGAHIGLFTLAAAAQVGPAGRVIAFEPAQETRRNLIRNIELSGFTWVDVRSNALADRCESREFLTFGEQAWGSSSFAPPKELPGARREVVETVTLDSALEGVDRARIRLVKLDLEGAELAALTGARNLLETVRPDLLIEAEPEHLARQGASVSEIFALLNEYGYRIYRATGDASGEPYTVRVTGAADWERDGTHPNLFATVR